MKAKQKLTMKFLMLASILPCVAIAADAKIDNVAGKTDKEIQKEIIANEAAHREAVLESLWGLRSKIQELEKAGNYQDADLYYKELIDQLSSLKGSAAKEKIAILKQEREKMHNRWIEEVVKKAEVLAADKNYEEAKAVVATIVVIDEERGGKIAQDLIDKWQAVLAGQSYRVLGDITDPDWQKYPVIDNLRLDEEEKNKIRSAMASAEAALAEENYDRAANEVTEILTIDINNVRAQKILEKTFAPRIDKLLLEAETYMKNNHFEQAVKCLERVYLLDPYNIKATTMLGRAYKSIYSYAHKRHRTDVENLVAMADWSWVEPVKIEMENNVQEIKTEIKLDKNPLQEEMEKIIFPKFEVADLNVIDIINELSRRGKIYNNGKAIDMILKVEKNNPKFTKKSSFAFSNMPLSEILRYVTLNFGLKYKLDGSTVVIGDGIDNLVLRSFDVRDDLIATIVNDEVAAAVDTSDDIGGEEDMGGMGDMGGESTESSGGGSAMKQQGEKIKAYFKARGVDFPVGSTVLYTPRTTKLSVRNTEENLRKLGELLEQLMMIETPMVMTDVKIVQVSETNFEELGFDWNFTLDHGDDWSLSLSSAGVGGGNIRTGGDGISDTERDTALIKDINIFPKLDNKIFGATPNLKLTVYALSENGRSEILSTPRLISRSGQTASIKLVTKTKYPESWDEPDTDSSNDNNLSISFPVPELSDFTEQGVFLTVTPVVAPDNRTINLTINPKITTIITESPDSTYNYVFEQGIINPDGSRTPIYKTSFPIWMPETNRKEISAKLKVYDGETIMIGGVMQNEVNRRLDKMPIFGDIPFLGRLFQNRAEDANKVNYLIFITARLVNHNGRPVNPLVNTATPSFNF